MQLLRVFVAHGGVDVVVAEYQLGDVRRHAGQDGVGGEDPPEVVGPECDRLAVGAGDARRGEGAVEEAADPGGGDRPVFQGDDPLEQQRRRRVPDALVGVVGGDERDAAAGAADPGDDRGQDVGQFRADDDSLNFRERGVGVSWWGYLLE
jgi:hypothetical protein